MAWIDTLFSAFKGGESDRVPLAPGFASGIPGDWIGAFEAYVPENFEYTSAVHQSYLSNPIVQRAVRIASEGIAQAPSEGAEIRAGFLFDVPVRFAEDRIDISGVNFAAGEAPSIPLIELRETSQ